MPEPYTYAANTDTMSGILDTHAADAVCGILFWWYSTPMAMIPIEPMPCVASSGGDRHLCSRHHEPDTHGHDADTMSGILDAHATDTMNQIPMPIMLMPMELIPNFVDGNFICKWYQLSAVERPFFLVEN